jgi:hypothetical protein
MSARYSQSMLDPQLLASIGEARDFDALTDRLVRAANALGFGLTSGVLIRGRYGSPGAVVAYFGNPPEAYVESSASLSDGLRDPVLAGLLAKPGFMTYDQATYAKAGVMDLWDLQAAHGYKRGLAVSHHAPSHGEAFLLGVDGPDRLPADPVMLLRLRSALHLVALQAQQCAERLTRVEQAADPIDSSWAATMRESALAFASRGGLVKIEELRRALNP